MNLKFTVSECTVESNIKERKSRTRSADAYKRGLYKKCRKLC